MIDTIAIVKKYTRVASDFCRKNLTILFIGLLIADTIFSYYQHAAYTIDGDVVSIITPSEGYKKILSEPFGFKAFMNQESYAATNRFFAHWTLYHYYRQMPLLLQHFMSPIDSLYAAQAIAKTIIQMALIILLGIYISIPFGFKRKDFLLGAVLVCPLFQARGCFEYMGLIDNCITYTMFYALPSMLLLIFLLPYYSFALTGKSNIPLWAKPLWLVLAVVLAFHGPLSAPVLLIICPMTLLYCAVKEWNNYSLLSYYERFIISIVSINRQLLLSFLFVIFICMYSFYVGTYNSETISNAIPLNERYDRLLDGISVILLSWREGITPLCFLVLFNIILLYKIKNTISQNMRTLLVYIVICSFVYIALLPLGGFRDYRTYIMRRDTLQPALFALFFIWGFSSVCIFKSKLIIDSIAYKYILFSVCIVYTFADPFPFYANDCERRMLKLLSE